MKTAVLLHLDEPSVLVPPSDAVRGIADLVIDTGLTAPAVVESILGKGRQFGAGKGLRALEATTNATRLRRTMAIEAIVSTTSLKASNATRTIIARGLGGAGAARRLWGLQVVTTGAPGSPVVTIQMFWDSGGAGATVPGVAFTVPEGGWAYFAAVRRWRSSSAVDVDYFVNGELVGSVTSTGGAIEDGDAGYTTLGCRGNGAGGYENHWSDIIDEVRISNTERTAEEIRHMFRERFVYPLEMYETLKQLLPPGQQYPRDPDSAMQRELMVEADGLANAYGVAEELREDFLPQRATKSLDRWEAITGSKPKPADTIADRRARVLAYLRTVHGFSREKIQEAMAPYLLQDPEDVQIVENSNRRASLFEDDVEAYWVQEPNDGAITWVGPAEVTLDFGAGDDARWDESQNLAVGMRTTNSAARGFQARLIVTDFNLGNEGDAFGLYYYHQPSGQALLCGVIETASGPRYFTRRIVGGVATDTVYSNPAPIDTPPFQIRTRQRDWLPEDVADLRIEFRRRVGVDDGTFVTIGLAAADFVTGLPADAQPGWFGVFLLSADASPANPSDVTIAGIHSWAPWSRAVFDWFVYRDPGLGGSPDLAGAQLTLNRLKPAHTRGGVTESLGLLTDDPYSLTDLTPLGL